MAFWVWEFLGVKKKKSLLKLGSFCVVGKRRAKNEISLFRTICEKSYLKKGF